MLILGLTDIHGHIAAPPVTLSGADLILIAGDLTHFGGREDAGAVLDALSLPGVALAAVPGNCDGEAVSSCLEHRGASVHRKIRRLGGIPVYGLGGALPGPGSTPREYDEETMARYLDDLAAGEDLEGGIMVCHQPPYKTKVDRAMGMKHVGSRAVRLFIERARPALCLTGHIHESAGIDRIGNTVIVNPGPFRHGKYALCRLENGSVTCTIERQ